MGDIRLHPPVGITVLMSTDFGTRLTERSGTRTVLSRCNVLPYVVQVLQWYRNRIHAAPGLVSTYRVLQAKLSLNVVTPHCRLSRYTGPLSRNIKKAYERDFLLPDRPASLRST